MTTIMHRPEPAISARTGAAQGLRENLGIWEVLTEEQEMCSIYSHSYLVRSRNPNNVWVNVEKRSTTKKYKKIIQILCFQCFCIPGVGVENRQWKKFSNLSYCLNFYPRKQLVFSSPAIQHSNLWPIFKWKVQNWQNKRYQHFFHPHE